MSEELMHLFHQVIPDSGDVKMTPETRLTEDLGLNSLHFMLLAMAMEDTFHIRIPDGAVFQTVGDVCAFMENNPSAEA